RRRVRAAAGALTYPLRSVLRVLLRFDHDALRHRAVPVRERRLPALQLLELLQLRLRLLRLHLLPLPALLAIAAPRPTRLRVLRGVPTVLPRHLRQRAIEQVAHLRLQRAHLDERLVGARQERVVLAVRVPERLHPIVERLDADAVAEVEDMID